LRYWNHPNERKTCSLRVWDGGNYSLLLQKIHFSIIYILLYFKFCFSFDLFLPCLGIWFIIYVGTIIIKALKNSDILFIFPFFALLVGLWILIFFFYNFDFFVCKHNWIDKHLRNRVMQLIIRRELRGGNLLKYEKAFSEEKVVYDKTKVCFVCCFYIFQFSCFCIILDFWFVTSCVMYKNSITKELLMYFFPFILF
jgi:hypothetical protein